MPQQFKPVESNQDFIQMEKKWLKHWYEKGIVSKYLKKNANSEKRFSFLDGPITANNPMGVHHAWGRTFKDLWQKFNNLLGKKQRFQNGFDCQGLWVEVEVEKELGIRTKKDIENLIPGNKKSSIAKFVELCKERVLKFSAIQTEQTKRLGNFMDWDHSYFTMADENNYMIWHFLKKCYENRWIYKGRDSVPWCPRCETAISQHEMLTEDYKELTHETVFFKLPIQNKGWENTYLLVWTTTPWTIPANAAAGINKKFTYGVWENHKTKEKIIFIDKDENGKTPTRMKKNKELSISDYIFDGISQDEDYKKVKEIKSSHLIGLKYKAPFDNLERTEEAEKENPKTFHSVVDASDIVVATEGTGLLHVAPGAGQEDFKLGKKENLPVIAVIADNADYLDKMGEFSGKNAKKHPEIIIDYLKNYEDGRFLFKTIRFTHRYPACWRCKTELVWKVADEWYISMDIPSQFPNKSKIQNSKSNNLTLRKRMMNVAKKIHWLPEFGLDRELDWLKNMHDWLISKKNRYWGLALPIYECKKCGHFEVLGSKEELKKRAVKGWDQFDGRSPHKPYIDEVVIKCIKCGQEVTRIDDVGNPWLDAGIVPYSTITENNQEEPLYLKNRKEWQKWFPIDFITESFPGQFKNWFYSIIAMSTVLENINPFKTVLGFGTLVGEDGRPMHKSWGNAIEFNEGADNIGVDVMRWMYARHNPADNLLFGYKRAEEVRRQFYLMLWNVYRFFVEYAKLDKINIEVMPNSFQHKKNILDKWILNRFYLLVDFTKNSLEKYNIKEAVSEVEKFVSDLSTWYIRRSRERVWVNSQNEEDKMRFYSTLYEILTNLSIILSPILPFVSEEIYTNLTSNESVHLKFWPDFSQEKIDQNLIKDMELLREMAEVGHRVRKEIKIKVRQPLAKAAIGLKKDARFLNNNLSQYEELIKSELNVKEIDWKKTDQDEITVQYDINLTDKLIKEGALRELIRKIQAERKALQIATEKTVKLTIPKEFETDKEFIKRRVLASDVSVGDTLKVVL